MTPTSAVFGTWADKIRFVDIAVKMQVKAGAASYPLDVIAQQNGTTVLLVSYDENGVADVRTLGQFPSVTFPLPATIRIANDGTTISIEIP